MVIHAISLALMDMMNIIRWIHSHVQELAESLIQDLNENNKYNVKKSRFSYIDNGIILKSLMICPFYWGFMGVITL